MSDSGSKSDQKTSPGVFFLASLFFFCYGLLTFRGDLANYKNRSTFEAPIPPAALKEYPTLFGDVDETTQAFLVYSNRETKFRVYFDSRNSIKGWWRGSNATLQITAPYTQFLPATTNTKDKWGFIITSEDVDPFTPWLDVTLSVDPQYNHTWISALVSQDIVYPYSNRANFINQEEHFSREVRLFVTSEDDIEVLEAQKSWTYEPKWWEPWVLQLIAWPPALVLFVVGLFAQFRAVRVNRS
jgi:hypothetical protein